MWKDLSSRQKEGKTEGREEMDKDDKRTTGGKREGDLSRPEWESDRARGRGQMRPQRQDRKGQWHQGDLIGGTARTGRVAECRMDSRRAEWWGCEGGGMKGGGKGRWEVMSKSNNEGLFFFQWHTFTAFTYRKGWGQRWKTSQRHVVKTQQTLAHDLWASSQHKHFLILTLWLDNLLKENSTKFKNQSRELAPVSKVSNICCGYGGAQSNVCFPLCHQPIWALRSMFWPLELNLFHCSSWWFKILV